MVRDARWEDLQRYVKGAEGYLETAGFDGVQNYTTREDTIEWMIITKCKKRRNAINYHRPQRVDFECRSSLANR